MAHMEQRISLITLGVADLRRAMDFYAGLGWEGRSPDGDVAFFQAGGMVFALWGRDKLAADSTVDDPGGWGGTTVAHCVRSPEEVDAVLAEARAAGATIAREGAATFWGFERRILLAALAIICLGCVITVARRTGKIIHDLETAP